MAIRMALGSQRAGIVRLVLESGAKLAAVGCVLGLGGAIAASTLLRSLLFGVSPFDPLVLTLAAIGILLLAVVASTLPARCAPLPLNRCRLCAESDSIMDGWMSRCAFPPSRKKNARMGHGG
jgi:uncharacterized membrane protein YeaQ/YmgE (transglycosylase-associated protein family)